MIVRQRHLSAAFGVAGRPSKRQRWLSNAALEHLQRPVQSYLSPHSDPSLNLSIEHYLLQKTPPDSAVLFLYVNRPSIIIGRNQNPWLEVNLRWAHSPQFQPPHHAALGPVELVRRRSGGGTVFHDEGNVNWTVISPSARFTRDKHAEMVVRALRSLGVDRSRVNERHDIVLDQGTYYDKVDDHDTHRTAYQTPTTDQPAALKVSGSAYKLTRGRALHHGTCLLSSPNLNVIPQYLRSPAKSFITARGVESVSSPVGNISLSNDQFISAVQEQFAKMYHNSGGLEAHNTDGSWTGDVAIRDGVAELKSPEWTYLQTPQFTISTNGLLTSGIGLDLSAKYGTVVEGKVSVKRTSDSHAQVLDLSKSIEGMKIHEVQSWPQSLRLEAGLVDPNQAQELHEWLETMLPARQAR